MIKEIHIYEIDECDIPFIESIISNEKDKYYIFSNIEINPINRKYQLEFVHKDIYNEERIRNYGTKH